MLAAICVVVLLPAAGGLFAAERPNIILVMTDDQGYGDLACHGNPLIRTPHLDQFHSESVRFTDFHVSPTCAPTRAALLTGRHEFKNGVTHTILERERLTPEAVTLAEVLRSTGYATGIFGKWHLGDEAAYQPDRRGFDEVFIHGAGGIGQTYPGSCGDAPRNSYFNPAILHNGRFVKTEGYCTDVFFGRAIAWMDEQQQRDGPFFAYITPNTPHSPLISPGPEYDAFYEGRGMNGQTLKEGDVAYYSMITNIDDNVGRLMAKLKEWGIERDTLLIFLTDNGGTHTRLYSAGMRGGKGAVYQGGHRVPSFWRWPAAFEGGVDCPALTAHIDVLPTLAAITGASLDEKVKQQIEGRSLFSLLRDPRTGWEDRTLVTHQGRWKRGQAAESKHRNCAIRNNRFSLVNNQELYDLESDPGETMNVIDRHPGVVAELRAAYDEWWSEVQPMLVNEDAVGPEINPFKVRYWEQFGGGPDEEMLRLMDPARADRF
jgi:arylsulfatase